MKMRMEKVPLINQSCETFLALFQPFCSAWKSSCKEFILVISGEEFNINSFGDGNLWCGLLYQSVEHGASWWRTCTVLRCLLCPDCVKAGSLTFPHRDFSAEAWSISADLSRRKKKKKELWSALAELTEVLGPCLSQGERSQCQGRSLVP